MKSKKKITSILLLIFVFLTTTLLTGCGKTYKMVDILKTNKPIYDAFISNCDAMSDTYSKYLSGMINEQDFIKRVQEHKKVNDDIKKKYKADFKNKKLKKYDRNTTFFNVITQMGYEFDTVDDVLSKSVENGKAKDRVLIYDIYTKEMNQVKFVINDYQNFFNDFVDGGAERLKLNNILK